MLRLGPFAIHGDEAMSGVDIVPERICFGEILVRIFSPPVQAFPLSGYRLNTRYNRSLGFESRR